LGITVHFVQEDTFEQINLVTATKEVKDLHTGENLATWMEAVLNEYDL